MSDLGPSTIKPICYDLFCGLGGWSEAFLAEGYECIGFDIEAHDYGTGGYPGKLILRDIRSIHGSELKDATCIVASPPCQAYSYRAMPWKRAKALPPPDNTLFNECFRIQREASEAAGHHIPMVVENVRGAQKWVGKAQWNYGSFYLWGDVPALMPMRFKFKASGKNWNEWKGWDGNAESKPKSVRPRGDGESASENMRRLQCSESLGAPLLREGSVRLCGMSGSGEIVRDGLKGIPRRTAGHWTNPAEHEGVKEGGDWWNKECRKTGMARFGSKSNARKAASAMIAKIPFPLAQHIARVFKPEGL